MVTFAPNTGCMAVSVRTGKDQQPAGDHYPCARVQEPCTSDTAHQCPTETVPLLPRVMKFSVANAVRKRQAAGPEQSKTCGWRRSWSGCAGCLKMVHELAAVLNAEVGCSRQLPKARTGWSVNVISVSPACAEIRSLPDAGDLRADPAYGCGNGAKVIVAINKDKNAPIFTMPTTVWWAISTKSSLPWLAVEPLIPLSTTSPAVNAAGRDITHVGWQIWCHCGRCGRCRCVAALVMARAGLDVLVIERGTVPDVKTWPAGVFMPTHLKHHSRLCSISAGRTQGHTRENPFLTEESAVTLDFHREQPDVRNTLLIPYCVIVWTRGWWNNRTGWRAVYPGRSCRCAGSWRNKVTGVQAGDDVLEANVVIWLMALTRCLAARWEWFPLPIASLRCWC